MGMFEKLTESIVEKNLLKETNALVSKWEKSGLLEGLKTDLQKRNLSMLLENQAKELLRESTTMAGGDVQGFASVAFPIVRRVFAGLIANELVSVQPMSLPSGLIFFLDFKRTGQLGLDGDVVKAAGASVFGDRLGHQLTGGVRIDGEVNGHTEKGFYNLANGYGTARQETQSVASNTLVFFQAAIDLSSTASIDTNGRYFRHDPDVAAETTRLCLVCRTSASTAVLGTNWDLIAEQDLASFSIATGSATQTTDGSSSLGISPLSCSLVRRLTKIVEGAGSATGRGDESGVKYLETVWLTPSSSVTSSIYTMAAGQTFRAFGCPGNLTVQYPIKDRVNNVGSEALGAVVGASPWALEGSNGISAIDIKVDSYSITSRTRKLKANWTPELSQDLSAYQNLDAEAELTSILAEIIGLEVDQEILSDLVKGSTAGTRFWSRRPGKYVNRKTGADISNTTTPPDFTGNVSMWYETLLETVNDVSALIHRKTLRGGANFLVVSPEVANIIEFTAGFRGSVTHDDNKGTAGVVKIGDVSKKWDLWVDPYFPRNVILVGRKGSSFLESGYLYAPYVPLQTTPTIFDPNDFTPRKAVLTRYGKTMVRPDMYGLVVVADLEG